MAPDERKVSLISEFLEDSFVGCSVYDSEDKHRMARSYRVINNTTGKVVHHIFVSRAFFDDHPEAEIVSTLRNLALLERLRVVGDRPVIVRSQTIEIERNT